MSKIVCYGYQKITDGDYIFSLGGLSTMTKPLVYEGMTVGEGSLFIELDTKTIYYFNGTSWSVYGGE